VVGGFVDISDKLIVSGHEVVGNSTVWLLDERETETDEFPEISTSQPPTTWYHRPDRNETKKTINLYRKSEHYQLRVMKSRKHVLQIVRTVTHEVLNKNLNHRRVFRRAHCVWSPNSQVSPDNMKHAGE
jgi:hypothetical protein